jgi:hypothetical protein
LNELIEVLRGLPVGGISFGALVSLTIVLILKGEIIPKSTYEAMIKGKEEENVMLKEAYRMSEKARETSAVADQELLELGRTTVHMLESIHQLAQQGVAQ